ncbi:MAG: TonB-dependent receptor [Myxococcota bacterium]
MVADASGVEEPVDTIMVTTLREPRSIYKTPASVTSLSGDQIERRLQPRNLPEALVDVPGVLMQKTSAGQASPYLRGQTGFHTLLLVDGVRINNSVLRPGPNQYWATVDPFGIERLETSLGPGGALYGTDAVGGITQAFTRSPWMSTTNWPDWNDWNLGGRALYRYGSADKSHQGRVEAVGTHGEKIGMMLGVSPKTFDDLEAGRDVGEQDYTRYDELDFDAKLVLRPSHGHEISMLYQNVSQDDVPRTHKTIFAVPFEDTTVGDELKRELDQDRELAYVQYKMTEPRGFVDRAHVSVSWQNTDEDRDRIRGDGRRDKSGFEVDTVGTFGQFDSDTPFGQFTYGWEYYHDFVNSRRRNWNADGSYAGGSIQGPVGDDADYDLFGTYARWSYTFADQVEVFLGGRFTYARADIGTVEDAETGLPISIDDDWTNFSGSLRVLWTPCSELSLYGSVIQGFRAPNISDLSRLDTARTDEIQTPSTNLDPEEFVNFELGAKTRGDRWSGGVAAYYTLIDDGLIRTPTGRIIDGDEEVQTSNVGDGYITGFEVEGDYRLYRKLHLFGNLAFLYGTQDTYPTANSDKRAEKIDRMMPLNGQAGLRWGSVNDRFWGEVSTRWSLEQDRLNTRDKSDTQRIPPGGTPDWYTVDLYGGGRITRFLRVGLAVENITDQTYRFHGSGITSPGTNVKLTAEIGDFGPL